MGKRIVLILGVMLVLCGSVFADSSAFEQGNDFYKNKEFDKAIDAYKSVIAQGVESAPLYYNLGNAYFKNGDLGHAVLYYMKAKRLDPGDGDIRNNLTFAKKFSTVQMEGVELNPISAFVSSLVDTYRLSFLAWVSSFFFILFMVSLMIRFGLGMNVTWVRMFTVISLILLIVSSGLTTFKYRHDYLTRRAVIIADNSKVYTGASDKSDVELEGAPGLVVEILSESSDYYNVLFENKRRGWIKKDLVAEI